MVSKAGFCCRAVASQLGYHPYIYIYIFSLLSKVSVGTLAPGERANVFECGCGKEIAFPRNGEKKSHQSVWNNYMLCNSDSTGL